MPPWQSPLGRAAAGTAVLAWQLQLCVNRAGWARGSSSACPSLCHFCWLHWSFTPIYAVGKILLLMRQSCFLSPPDLPKPATLNSDTLIFLQEERGKIQEGTNLRPHQWEPGLIEIVMRIQSQTNRQVGKTQSHRCDRDLCQQRG